MFTGIIQLVGRVARIKPVGGDVRITIDADADFMAGVSPGDSIALSGACMTAVDLTASGFSADVSRESLSLTTLGELTPGSKVNLEKSLTPSTPMGGHFVTGHVDGIGELIARRPDGRSIRMDFKVPEGIARLVAAKGSIAIDGISLTVNTVLDAVASVNIVPHTLEATTLGDAAPGAQVNVEADLLARYLARMLEGGAHDGIGGGITKEFLKDNGYT